MSLRVYKMDEENGMSRPVLQHELDYFQRFKVAIFSDKSFTHLVAMYRAIKEAETFDKATPTLVLNVKLLDTVRGVGLQLSDNPALLVTECLHKHCILLERCVRDRDLADVW